LGEHGNGVTGKKPNQKMQAWIDARKRHHLSDAQVQMARELGMNPHKLGKIDNHKQEPWKEPLPEFIDRLYRKQFGKSRPDNVRSIEERCRHDREKKEAKSAARRQKGDS
jgi:SOS-response transcriptional repressor LexA